MIFERNKYTEKRIPTKIFVLYSRHTQKWAWPIGLGPPTPTHKNNENSKKIFSSHDTKRFPQLTLQMKSAKTNTLKF